MPGELPGITSLLADILGPFEGPGGRSVGVAETASAPVAAVLASQADGPLLLLTPSASRAQALAEELPLFLSEIPVIRFAERERLPYEFAANDPGVALERSRALDALSGTNRAVVVASWAAASEHIGPPGARDEDVQVAAGEGPGPGALLQRLEAAGYEHGFMADRPGTFARRGGIVDVFAVRAEQPYRLEFLADAVESIRILDVRTQRSTGRVDRAAFPAAATATSVARKAATALAGRLRGASGEDERVLEQLQLLAEGNRSDFAGFFEPLLFEATMLAHLSDAATVVVEDGADGPAVIERAAEQERRARRELELRAAVPEGLPALRIDAIAFTSALERFPNVVRLERFGTADGGSTRLPLRPVPGFAGRLKVLATQCRDWAREGLAVVVASQQALRLAELMDEEGLRPKLARSMREAPRAGEVALVPLAVGSGFLAPGRLVLVTDAEVFGFRKRRRPTRSRPGVNVSLVSTLEVGDYLVHADHGIARFGGLVRKTVDGVEREYLELQYAEGDRLYAPTDQLDAISRYVGPGDHAPSLTRLGSQEWARARRRVRQAVLEMAHELLDLYARRQLAVGHAFAPDGPWQMEMEAAFPYVETPEQLEAIDDVKADMEQQRPMDRLICGDVGYGKTEVAIRAAFKAVADGRQVALLVPTTVLAEQHGATFRERTAGFPVRVEVLSRFRSEAEQRALVGGIAAGEVDIAIGTHRLLGRDVSFKDLGLVVIDEEQRFGVSHKERLRQMRAEVDTLTLSATPIPRTLQMALSGIRDMSTIMTPPEERLPIRTYVLQWDDEIIREAVDRELQRGGQVYFVHNRVHNIERIVARLRNIVPDAEIAVGHGQMPEEQLERVMMEFAAGDHDILVCTTIIESGLDIPNVNTIVINDADRLGLAQLYQLRGRVGRGANRAYAYLLHDRDRQVSEQAGKRLEAIFESTELGAGFQIALRDLEIRGAGNVLGAEQSGHIAAIGFELYSKLVAEAVAALKAAARGDEAPPPLVPSPAVELPLSAHVPDTYIEDIHDRLAVYQRISGIDSTEAITTMSDEMRDRFGPVPAVVENLLYVALVKTLARQAAVEGIRTDEQMFHIRVRGGLSPTAREAVEKLKSPSVVTGPRQVRIDRATTVDTWTTLLVKVLRAMRVAT